MKRMLVGVVAFLIAVGVALADDMKGTVKSVNVEKRTITMTIDDNKERTYEGTPDLKVVTGKGKLKDVPNGLAALKPGDVVNLTLTKKDDKLVFTQVLISPPKK